MDSLDAASLLQADGPIPMSSSPNPSIHDARPHHQQSEESYLKTFRVLVQQFHGRRLWKARMYLCRVQTRLAIRLLVPFLASVERTHRNGTNHKASACCYSVLQESRHSLADLDRTKS